MGVWLVGRPLPVPVSMVLVLEVGVLATALPDLVTVIVEGPFGPGSAPAFPVGLVPETDSVVVLSDGLFGPGSVPAPPVGMVSVPDAVGFTGRVRVTLEPVGPQDLQKVTVVNTVSVEVDATALSVSEVATGVSSAVVVGLGRVSVTVVGVAAQ